MRYGILNNKGGVGKTFLSFIIDVEYAHRNSDDKVILVDMCPQANFSEIVIGRNGIGSNNLEGILEKKDALPQGDILTNEQLLRTRRQAMNILCYSGKKYNKSIPENVYLVCGDPSFELQSANHQPDRQSNSPC
ncbi:MAG: AAA family ATPase [Desulfovibrio sp.]|jgi:cellulose biosynthesis protein BcsQ|nr:AAA family ATPase [Desulfovibrio sp.]